MIERSEPAGICLEGVSATMQDRNRGAIVAVRNVDLDVKPGELLTLLGPSGCGKTTTLRMIAGFQEPSGGKILIAGRDVTHVPANQRDIGFVFQNYALFPHLTIFGNVAYGLQVRNKSASELQRAVTEALELVGLAGFGERLPNELSGGQQQRVALARAIVIRPRVLLFDEPLSNLDAKLRVSMRGEIRHLQRTLKITTVYVTHDQEEAMAISDRIAVMEAGRIVQLDTAEALYRRPGSAFVAGFIGRANLLRATVESVRDGRMMIDIGGQKLVMRSEGAPAPGNPVSVIVRPESIAIVASSSGPTGVVRTRTYLGDKIEYEVTFGGQMLNIVRFNPADDEEFLPGDTVSLRIPETNVRLV
ncbi:ABC transporter ATP-binding protein [Bradyrhizobium sp. AZCC 2289]|uniref:ABC transporter ATP-binding protein n=1 Tax=Bradyrhizobium sp. AZCC 2289 TaxID=3117026 RepID=UPI002FF40856